MKKKFNILALATICALGCVISSCSSSNDVNNTTEENDSEDETPIFVVPDIGGGSTNSGSGDTTGSESSGSSENDGETGGSGETGNTGESGETGGDSDTGGFGGNDDNDGSDGENESGGDDSGNEDGSGEGGSSSEDGGSQEENQQPNDPDPDPEPVFDESTLSGRLEKLIYENGGDITNVDFSQNTDYFSEAEVVTYAYSKFCYSNENSTLYTFSRADSDASILGDNIQITGTAWLKRGNKIFKENTSKNNLQKITFLGQTITDPTVHFTDRTYNYNATTGTYVDDYGYDVYRDPDLSGSTFNTTLTYNANYASYGKTNKTLSQYASTYYLNPTYCSNYMFMNSDASEAYVDKNASDTVKSVLFSNTTYAYKTGIELNSNSTYTVSLALTSNAYAAYSKYMTTTTTDQGSATVMQSEPTFDYVLVRFTLDRSLNFISGIVREKYYVNVKASSNTETDAESVYVFDYEDDSAIPGLSTTVDYSQFKSYL